MRFPSPRSIMTGQFLRRAIPTAVTLAVFGMSPARAAAQSALRASADVPSGGAEARLQNDSLAAHLLRTPRSKPAALTAGGRTGAQARKLDGKPEPVTGSAPVITPLPTRARVTKP